MILAGLSQIQKIAGGILVGALALSLVANGFLTRGYIKQRERVVEVQGQCETDKATAIAEKERAVRTAMDEAHQQDIADLRAQIEAKDRHIGSLMKQREHLAAMGARQSTTIMRLTEESFDEEMPDSGACLSAFLFNQSLIGMPRAENCAGPGNSGDRETDMDTGAGGDDGAQPHFANITYEDAIILWGRDRRNLVKSNCQLTSIRSLSDETATTD